MRTNQYDKLLSLRIPLDEYKRLRYLAAHRWANVSSVIREGIRKELEETESLSKEDVPIPNKVTMKGVI